jgi:aminoglycoside/choline kinase family phosphotransferase
MQEAITALYTRTFGRAPARVVRLAADGSQRLYYRLTGDTFGPVIGAYGPDPDENRAFLSFSRSFRGAGLPVPEIYAAEEPRRVWLEEDLGDTTLFGAVSAARADGPALRAGAPGAFPPVVEAAYARVLEVLPRFQVEGARVVDFSVAYPRAAFDEQSMLWDLNYFKYHFLKLAHVPFNEQRLEDDFHRLIAHLLGADTGYFLYRDFQSRNILLRDGAPWFVDYQGGRRGAAQYDVASLLYDAKADIPETARARLLEGYLDAFTRLAGTPRERFLATYRGHVLIRIVQAMGAYGYRGFFERKVRFLESVPFAARNVAGLLAAGLPVELPELEAVFRHVVDEWADRASPIEAPRGLSVHVASFSYRDGWPPDEAGHGGGHVFDCRWLPNPGRLQELAGHTGRDVPIVRFLEAIPETELFWGHVRALVEAHIANFRERNFSDLSVAFGCTGGQHRSVYFAERLARHVRERHPDVTVHLRHTASGRWALREPGAAPPPKDTPWKG